MADELRNAFFALALGGIVCVLLFVPFVALSYRRRGKLSPGRVAVWVGAAIYAFAIWTYTLMPLPASDDFRCVGLNLNPLDIVDEISAGLASSNPLTSPHILQLVLNVLLFLPLGFFVRVLAGRGFFVTVLIGFLTSLLVELTQLTGVWGVYHCAYRLFDVVDLGTNTLGAALGALAAFLIPARMRTTDPLPDADIARPVTRGRRIIAALCDFLGFYTLAFGLTVAIAIVTALLTQQQVQGSWANDIGFAVASAVWIIVILASGRSIGDLSVQLRYRSALPTFVARPLRIITGVVGWNLLSLIPGVGGLASLAFGIVAVIMIFATKDGRGLPGVAMRAVLVDSREREGHASGGSVPADSGASSGG